ncbi:hypothetical protein CHS0354_015237 [Potamilus streckersoni]|uniref:Uncharacterized protein n=1 Tax=Potamilus streckersoni TaxID=2493646 RepID=A0AAE0VH89_9BIVA|nr:hypothetical protein CHS0354_015237 [Potamilus streckersoni]
MPEVWMPKQMLYGEHGSVSMQHIKSSLTVSLRNMHIKTTSAAQSHQYKNQAEKRAYNKVRGISTSNSVATLGWSTYRRISRALTDLTSSLQTHLSSAEKRRFGLLVKHLSKLQTFWIRIHTK